ncbi:signal recognition particle receptor subunit beta-like [Pyrus ussuriensis x Pyrus communis]|uniref:Signal recognition particle receptor subunit beta n=1 Tax=Pyrus ussuriensis x Pyrus communis TaxID=2448454 RepID=A0A5N5HZI3_9ROSA|nr:signal recognition particle receptor subunit beta-like [Pyrus ussuriensis x Pyrus communis]
MAVLLFTTFLLLLVRLLKRPKANTILVIGLSSSHKTVLFYQISTFTTYSIFFCRDDSFHQGIVTPMVNPIYVIDVSGHSRLDDFLPEVAGIVFVVDAVEFLPNCRAASDFICTMYLYNILTKASVVRKKIPVLILCNKTNKVTAHSKEFILKQWRRKSLGERFAFSQCQNKVTVGEASGLGGEISQVEQFIRDNIKS